MITGVWTTVEAVTQPATPSAAPWWGTALIAGFFVIVGGAISAVSGWWTDQQRSKRELRRRWDDDIRQFGADFLSHADSYVRERRFHESWSRVMLGTDRPEHIPEEVFLERRAKLREAEQASTAKMTESYEAMNRAYELLEFVAPAELMSVARSLFGTIVLSTTVPISEEDESSERIQESRRVFVSEMRKAIHLPPLERP